MSNYFSILLVVLTIASGLIWLLDSLFFAAKRRASFAGADGVSANIETDKQNSQQQGTQPPLPWLVDTAQQIFPVIAFVLILRSFLYEPFQIPSGSMMPTLLVGDFILVEKFTYGLKDPVARKQFYEVGKPERGDIAVFKFPPDPRLDYIKRVIGLPGDTIEYKGKQLYIKPACHDQKPCPGKQKIASDFVGKSDFLGHRLTPLNEFSENIGGVEHRYFTDSAVRQPRYFRQPGNKTNQWTVPEGQYFVMGDNRDNSEDSRFWGFVPEENLVGKAVAIWISFEFDRAPDSWLPSWVPTGVRFERVGGIQ